MLFLLDCLENNPTRGTLKKDAPNLAPAETRQMTGDVQTAKIERATRGELRESVPVDSCYPRNRALDSPILPTIVLATIRFPEKLGGSQVHAPWMSIMSFAIWFQPSNPDATSELLAISTCPFWRSRNWELPLQEEAPPFCFGLPVFQAPNGPGWHFGNPSHLLSLALKLHLLGLYTTN